MGNSSFRLVSSFSLVRVISFAIQIESHCSHVIWTTEATEVPQKLDIISACLRHPSLFRKKKKKSFTFFLGSEKVEEEERRLLMALYSDSCVKSILILIINSRRSRINDYFVFNHNVVTDSYHKTAWYD